MEPGRKAPYSADLHWRVVWKRLARQSSFKDIAKSLGISPSTAHRIYYEFIERGDVGPVKSKGPKRKLDDYVELFIIGIFLETPSLYLKEM